MPNFIVIKNTFILIFLLLGSWVVIHLFAIFGIFLAIAIPIFQLIFYPKILCFWCQIQHTKHSFRHSVIDSGIILLATIFSLALVYGETKLLPYLGIPFTQKTAEFAIPDKNSYKLGEIFPMKIDIKGIKVPINIVRADIQFDPNSLEVTSISTDNSFANIFIQKDFNNELGYARLTGGLPSPGFKNPTGTFGTIYFKGKQSGPVEVSFLPTSQVLANDGKGTNVLVNLAKATYIITTEKLSSDQMEFQDQLFKGKNSVLGANSDSTTQLTFTGYSDPLPQIPKVLGTSTTNAVDSAPSHSFIESLARLDNSILSAWTSFRNLLLRLLHL